MRIVLIGKAAFGEKVLQALIEKGEEVVGVYTPPDILGKINPLEELAVQLRIPTFQPKRMRAPDVYAEYIELEPDLNVMAYVTDILPETILNYPKLGTIQYHPSLLPRHRGGSAINWAIINGEAKTGATIFWPDEGIDTGPILLQKEVEISHDDTVGSLYFGKLFPLGIEALVESIRLIEKGAAPRIPRRARILRRLAQPSRQLGPAKSSLRRVPLRTWWLLPARDKLQRLAAALAPRVELVSPVPFGPRFLCPLLIACEPAGTPEFKVSLD